MGLNRNLGNIPEVITVSGNNIGINTQNPTLFAGYTTLAVNGPNGCALELKANDVSGLRIFSDTGSSYLYENRNTSIKFYTNGSLNATMFPNGNMVISNVIADAGYKLDVNGTGRFSGGNLQIEGGSYPTIQINGGSTGGGGIRFLSSGNTYAEIFGEYGSVNNGVLIFRTRIAGDIAERMRITTAGDVGIFKTLYGINNVRGGDGAFGGIDFYNTGIGYQYSAKIYTLKSSTEFYGLTNDFGPGTSGQLSIVAKGGSSSNIAIYTDSIERVRVTGGGDLLVGKQSTDWNNDGLQTEGNGKSIGVTNANSQNNLFLRKNNTTGNIVALYYNNVAVGTISITSSSTSYNTSSDYRLKEDLKPIAGALQRLQNLKPVNFAWKSSGERVDGFIAHELAEIIPESVTGEKDATKEIEVTPAVLDEEGNIIEEAIFETVDVYQGIDQSKIVPLLVASIQEQQEIIKQLTNRIINLENK